MEILGFATAVVTLVAALFGLIPPLLSKSQGGAKSDDSVSGFVSALTPIAVIGGMMGLYFFFMFGMTAIPRYMSSNRATKEVIEIKDVSNADRNLVSAAELMAYPGERDAALTQIIDHALTDGNFPLALLAASKISFSGARDEQLVRIRTAMTAKPAAAINQGNP